MNTIAYIKSFPERLALAEKIYCKELSDEQELLLDTCARVEIWVNRINEIENRIDQYNRLPFYKRWFFKL